MQALALGLLLLACAPGLLGCRGTALPHAPVEQVQVSAAEQQATGTPVRVCIVTEGGPTWAEALYREVEADTVVWTQAGAIGWREYYGRSHPYAHGRTWFERSERLRLPGSHSIRGGGWTKPEEMDFVPRRGALFLITPEEPSAGVLERVGHHDGVPLFAEAATVHPPEFYFLPVGPGCEFRAYMKATVIDYVRTDPA